MPSKAHKIEWIGFDHGMESRSQTLTGNNGTHYVLTLVMYVADEEVIVYE
jgi:hypothetical protein